MRRRITMASKEANKIKYRYNKKYVDAYWERKAAANHIQINNDAGGTVNINYSVSKDDDCICINRLDYKGQDERYIKALETSNRCLASENRRLSNMMYKYRRAINKISYML